MNETQIGPGSDRYTATLTMEGSLGVPVGIGWPSDSRIRQLPDTDPIRDVIAEVTSLDPWVLAAVTAAALAVIGVLAWYFVFRTTPGDRFKAVLSAPDSVDVLLHPNPDPDAMASAIAIVHLANHVGTTASIKYPGQIQHQENRAFEAVLDLDLERIESTAELDTEAVVLVDHNQPRGFTGAESIDPYAVVDHHPGQGRGRQFTDVRPDYGSCSTILAEYFEELDARVVTPSEEDTGDGLAVPSTLATGLMYGIQSDTNRLTSGVSPADFQACQYLYRGIDEETIDRIAHPQVEAEVLEVKARAIQNRRVDPPYAIANVERVRNVDAIPQSADELITLEGVTTVVVYGFNDGTMHLSGRSRDDRIHMGKSLEAAVDGIPMASAGGHARMGGGQVSVEHMEGIGPANGIGRAEFEDRLFDALRGTR